MKTIAKTNIFWASICLIILIFLTIYSLYSDINGAGLSQSMFYRTLGDLIYPVAYGGVLTGIFIFGNMIWNRNHYISYDCEFLYILGRNSGRLNSINNITIKQNFLGINSIYIEMKDRKIFPIKGCFLNTDVAEIQIVLSRLRSEAQ